MKEKSFLSFDGGSQSGLPSLVELTDVDDIITLVWTFHLVSLLWLSLLQQLLKPMIT